MRTDTAQPIRLKDYRPPDWLVETVSLDVSLHPTQTKVRATLALKPNPAAAAAPLVLDGDGLTLTGLKLDSAALPAIRAPSSARCACSSALVLGPRISSVASSPEPSASSKPSSSVE